MKITALTKKKLTRAQETDVQYGWPHLLALGKFGVGRTLLVKERSVLSVETIEGVADAIRRAGTVSSGAFVVLLNNEIKGQAPEPVDSRIIQTMVDAGAVALAVRRGYPIDSPKSVLAFADSQKIAVAEIDED